MPNHRSAVSSRAAIAAGLFLALAIAGCSAGAAPSPSPSPSPSTTPRATPTPVPGPTVSPTDPNTGIGSGPGTLPGGGPGNAGPALVSPVPGQLDPHPVDVTELHGQANDDGSYAVEARWWSGIAPCNVLDSVRVDRDDTARTLKITVLEGHGPQEIACIDIAQEKATIVVLGKLSSGHWTISAEGEAPPLPLDVP